MLPPVIDRDLPPGAVADIFAHGALDDLRRLPIMLSMDPPEGMDVGRICLELSSYADIHVRGSAAFAFGHLAAAFASSIPRWSIRCSIWRSMTRNPMSAYMPSMRCRHAFAPDPRGTTAQVANDRILYDAGTANIYDAAARPRRTCSAPSALERRSSIRTCSSADATARRRLVRRRRGDPVRHRDRRHPAPRRGLRHRRLIRSDGNRRRITASTTA